MSPGGGGMRRLRVLVIDDDPLLLRSLMRLLRAHHEVEGAPGGAVVLERLEAGADFDVIFCDLMMPGMDGITLYREICERHPQLVERMVFLTGGVFTDRVKSFLAEAAPTLVEKPATLEALLDAAAVVAESTARD